jgi:hypothetical protein
VPKEKPDAVPLPEKIKQFKELLESCKSRPTPKTNLDADAVAKLAYAGISGLGTNNENIKSAFDKLNTVDDFCAFSNKYFEMRFFLSYLCIVLKNNGVITKAGGNRPYERLATPHW